MKEIECGDRMDIFYNMNIFLVIILGLLFLFIGYYTSSFLIRLLLYLLTQKDKSHWKDDLKKMAYNNFWGLFGIIKKFKK